MNLDRKARCPCGSGRQYKACCYPVDRRREDEVRRTLEAFQRDAAGDRLGAERLVLNDRRAHRNALILAMLAAGASRGLR